ncbi:T9SS type A sorting domain-containing protein [Hymenobacter persicinus]|nr:T9SS type A sorting domain-containing protein [Hymenobacter persicinus]
MNRYFNYFEPPKLLALLVLCWALVPQAGRAQALYNGPGGVLTIADSLRYLRGDVENAGELSLLTAQDQPLSRLFIDEGDLRNAPGARWDAGRSTVVLLGLGTAPHVLSMHGAALFNLRLDNPAGTTLESDATVLGTLKLAGGNLLTAENASLRLGAAATVQGAAGGREDAQHYVKGSLVQQKQVGGPYPVDFGNAGFTLNPQDQLLTLTVERRTGLSQRNVSFASYREFAGRQSIDRIWRLSTSTAQNPAAPVLLTLAWLPVNDHGQDFDAGLAQVWSSTDQGVSWVREGRPQYAGARQVSVTTTRLNAWYTVSSTKPVLLTAEQLVFTAAPRQLDAILTWSTTSKPENGWFVIERSADGQRWQEISRQPVAGQSWSPAASTAVDKDAGRLAETLHYRLRQLGTDGQARSSSVLQVRFAARLEFSLEAYPVPMQDYLTLDLKTPDAGPVLLELYDVTGRPVLSQQATAPAGSSRYQLLVRELPLGVYTLRVRQGTRLLTRSLQRY